MKSGAYPCHYRDNKEEEAFPMAVHILFGKFNADGKHTNGNDDAGELEGNNIGAFAVSPRTGVEDVCSVWT